MNTMLRSSNAPTQSALAPSSLNNGGRPTSGGVHKGVWIGGGLMALTIVALATALVLKSNGSSTETVAPLAATTIPPVTETAAVPPAGTTAVVQAPVAQTPPAATPAPVAAPVHTTPRHTATHSAGSTTSHSSSGNSTVAENGSYGSTAGGNGTYSGSAAPSYSAPPAPPPVCTTCGTVEGYDPVQVQGSTNGVGAVGGGVAGAVLGSKIAGRNNHTLGAAIGAIGGGLLGNQIEKTQRVSTVYDVHVRMEDGSTRTIRQSSVPVVGQKVTVEGTSMHSRSSSSNSGGSTSYNNGGTNYQAQPSGNGSSSFSPSGN